MKIAFDVKGTLDGLRSERVVKLLRYCQSQGHEVIVWSSIYSWALDHAMKLNLKTDIGFAAHSKLERVVALQENKPFVDIAVDDDSGSIYLAAKTFIWVNEIPDDESKFAELLASAHEPKF